MELFRLRLNCIDHYQAIPTHFDPSVIPHDDSIARKDLPRVPVVRVFGATPTGQKVCAHVHGAFPYMYIEYGGSLAQEEVDAHIHRLHLSIDHALAVSYRRNMYDGKPSFVARVTLVKGTPFYGFHVGYKFYLKIYMLNPLHMTRLADLLRQGTIMNKVFQPYESHLQYLLQWMCDYNLYGCSYIDCGKVTFRAPVPSWEEMEGRPHLWHDRSIPKALISDEGRFPRQSQCSIEIDIEVQDILNRRDIKARTLHNDFLERSNHLSGDEKYVNSMASLWRDETRRRKARMKDASPGSSPFPPEVLISMSADPRSSQKGGWIHEEEYNEKVQALVADEARKNDDRKPSFDTFVSNVSLGENVKTALASVEELYPENIHTSARASTRVITAAGMEEDDSMSIQVDENLIATSFDDDIPSESDEEMKKEQRSLDGRRQDRVEEKVHSNEVEPNESEDDPPDNKNDLYPHPDDDILYNQPTSSSELPKIGVHRIQNLSTALREHFEIPTEYASDLEVQRLRIKRAKAEALRLHESKNRRKVFHDNQPAVAMTSIFENESMEDESSDAFENMPFVPKSPERTSKFDIDVYAHLSDTQPSHSLSHATKTSKRPLLARGRHPNSQDGLNNSLLNGKQKLPFAVVKDPHDPETIRRCSQPSSSPSKKSISFLDQLGSPKIVKSADGSLTTPTISHSTNITGFREAASQTQKVALLIGSVFGQTTGARALCFSQASPSAAFIVSSLPSFQQMPIIYQDAYYSDERDVPERPREYAGRDFRLESTTVPFLPEFDPSKDAQMMVEMRTGQNFDRDRREKNIRRRRQLCTLRNWEIAEPPPSSTEVAAWVKEQAESIARASRRGSKAAGEAPEDPHGLSQIEGPTQKNRHGFKYSQKQKSTSVQHEAQYMSLMSLEVHVNTRGRFVPNPEEDEIACVFWCLQSDDEELESNGINDGTHVGIIILSDEDDELCKRVAGHTGIRVESEATELDIINKVVDHVRFHDPDILTGYEVHNGSWGYLIERARYKYEYNLCDEISRMKSQSHGRFGKENDRWGFNHTSTIRVTGRHMINIWRAMRSELNLLQYTMENVVFHVLHRRIPHYRCADLTRWYQSLRPRDLARVIDYFVSRVQLDLEILEQNELVPRTSEQARLLGVDFYSVFSRGSQFKVESLMFRIAKPENFMLVSPSRKQVGGQNALECLPLVMEPQSDFYNSPLLVLDFQSLYPSVMIAYNYCYSTFLGRVVNWRGQNKMGFSEFKRQQRLLGLLQEHINIAPNGIMYVKPEIRKSLLAKMLGEILETRVMVKSGMKVDKDDKTLQRLLNNRQLALKLIANVTYGYTSASFSGRMPCSEIADSIVQTGRETLEKAIALIHSVKRWGAEVVYGDTDSLFVYLKGRTKDDAFEIGNEIAQTITNMNPRPIKLKFEKVYFPCVLLAKKRYVGFKYESKQQKEPDFDAKGIETVRRDGTPAEQKIEEKALKLLFRTADLSEVKRYFQRQCSKIMRGDVSIQDFCFAKEVKLGTYSDRGVPPPGAMISTKRMLEDPRTEPQYGERVPYVVMTGAPGARLIDRCVAPESLMQSEHNELDAEYYISKNIIPALERIFNLVGANVRSWYDEMPKYQRVRRVEGVNLASTKDLMVSKKTLESYMKASLCLVCRERIESEVPICAACLAQPEQSSLVLRNRMKQAEKEAFNIDSVCRSCAGLPFGDEVACDSKDCPVFYSRTKHQASLISTLAMTEPVLTVLGTLTKDDLDW